MPEQIDPSGTPRHVGIIMDGNGRWARQRGKLRTQGHLEGLTAAKRVVKAASDLGIRFLSLYTFSTENWKRAEKEVSYLMFLIRTHLRDEYDFYRANSIRVVHSGNLGVLPPEVIEEIHNVVRDTAAFPGLTVNLAINYGGRDEIVRAVNRLLAERGALAGSEALARREVLAGREAFARRGEGAWGPGDGTGAAVTAEELRACLDHPEIPDPDLIIRTGGEYRISNFLLWGSAYAELDFSPKLWPDWDRADLEDSIRRYQGRERRFGGLK